MVTAGNKGGSHDRTNAHGARSLCLLDWDYVNIVQQFSKLMFIFYAICIFLIFHKKLKCYSRVGNGKKNIIIHIRSINMYSTNLEF